MKTLASNNYPTFGQVVTFGYTEKVEQFQISVSLEAKYYHDKHDDHLKEVRVVMESKSPNATRFRLAVNSVHLTETSKWSDHNHTMVLVTDAATKVKWKEIESMGNLLLLTWEGGKQKLMSVIDFIDMVTAGGWERDLSYNPKGETS